jgi:hypothetical protein
MFAGTSDFSIRSGANGTGSNLPMTFYTGGSERVRIDTSGQVGIGGTAGAANKLEISGTLPTSGAVTRSFTGTGTIPSGTTTAAINYSSAFTTAAASFTLTDMVHFNATQPTLGAGSAATNIYGFAAQSSLALATNTYGFYGNIASGSNRYNVYMAGTADNYFAGNVGIGVAPSQKLDVAGTSRYTFNVGNAYTLQTSLNAAGSAFADDYKNALSHIWQTSGTQRMVIDSSGNVGIGGTADAQAKVQVLGTLPSNGGNSQSFRATGTIPSASTGAGAGFVSFPSTQAAAFTVTRLDHFFAGFNSLGASSAITTQYGFHADSSLTGATNNYGFFSNIASGSNRWNFYAAGTAQNYMAGRLGIGNSTFLDSEMLRITQASAKVALFVEITAASSTGNPGIGIRKQDNDNTTNQTYVSFTYNAGGNGAGGIQGNGANGVQFYSSSDARLKENVADLDGQLAKILALKPRKFDFINGPKDCTGFIAQEMETVYPDAVGEDVDGFKTIGGISVMEARLIKAIQELTARVAELEAK